MMKKKTIGFCHFQYGMIKTPWNLELHKLASDVSTITCN